MQSSEETLRNGDVVTVLHEKEKKVGRILQRHIMVEKSVVQFWCPNIERFLIREYSNRFLTKATETEEKQLKDSARIHNQKLKIEIMKAF
jgi:hypothetical protein